MLMLCTIPTFCLTVFLSCINAFAYSDSEDVAKKDSVVRVYEMPSVTIIGTAPNALQKIPGSGAIISSTLIAQIHPISTNEVLRRVPGVYVREEEGFGIRPNIGIRGLFPTRSTKVLLLEDGIPFALAPYGDPASYYHPPISRFNRIEVLKGSGQILFGPQTIGGVINYITPQPPEIPSGSIKLTSGNRNYFFGQMNYGGQWGSMGFLADGVRRQGDLARENTSTTIQDVNAKMMLQMTPHSSLSLKMNIYNEESNLTYAGITQIEYEENPFQNQFKDDWFFFKRFGSHLIHDHAMANGMVHFTTNVYGYFIKRDWWRQGNNGGTNSTDPGNTPGVRTMLNSNRNDGRNREYIVWGIDPRVQINHAFLGIEHETTIGIRAHFEHQDRKQIEGNSPTARTGIIREDNIRKAQAYSAFFQNRFFLNDVWIVSAGLRVENIHYERINNLNSASGKSKMTEVIPGFGVTFNPTSTFTLFTGVHRGFAPPRVEDLISNSDGSSIELDAEKSWSYELGARLKVNRWQNTDMTLFRMDFENQIIPASLAGGSGTTLTNAGKTLHQGIELKTTFSVPLDSEPEKQDVQKHETVLDISYTFLPTAEYKGTRYSVIDPSVLITGNRLTYAPKHMLTVSLGYAHPVGFDTRVEILYIGDQFSDDLNTVEPTPNGRQGLIPAYTLWNVSANYRIPALPLTTFVTVKNIFNKTFIADRSRGILPGSPRLVQAGLQWDF
ncbi:MAG: TonB-dependent receptor [Ignavibacteriae bacterium]|nr:TonB-dependent receptor [Ignavibacteriota bacterium]